MGYDSLISHYQAHEVEYYFRMFYVAFGNRVQFSVLKVFLYSYALKNGLLDDFLKFIIF